MTSDLPTLAEVRERFCAPEDHPPDLLETCVLGRQTPGSEAERILGYLQSFGVRIETLQGLSQGISGLEDEEELAAFECREGVAITHASDGWWLLFVEGDA